MMFVANSVLFFQSSLKTRARAPTIVSTMDTNLLNTDKVLIDDYKPNDIFHTSQKKKAMNHYMIGLVYHFEIFHRDYLDCEQAVKEVLFHAVSLANLHKAFPNNRLHH